MSFQDTYPLPDDDPTMLSNQQATSLDKIREALLPTKGSLIGTMAELEIADDFHGTATLQTGYYTSESNLGALVGSPFLQVKVLLPPSREGKEYTIDWSEAPSESSVVNTITAFNLIAAAYCSRTEAETDENLSWAEDALTAFDSQPTARLAASRQLCADFKGSMKRKRSERSGHTFKDGTTISRETTGKWVAEEYADFEGEFDAHIFKVTTATGRGYELHVEGNQIKNFYLTTPEHLELSLEPTEVPQNQYLEVFDEMLAHITLARRQEIREHIVFIACLIESIKAGFELDRQHVLK